MWIAFVIGLGMVLLLHVTINIIAMGKANKLIEEDKKFKDKLINIDSRNYEIVKVDDMDDFRKVCRLKDQKDWERLTRLPTIPSYVKKFSNVDEVEVYALMTKRKHTIAFYKTKSKDGNSYRLMIYSFDDNGNHIANENAFFRWIFTYGHIPMASPNGRVRMPISEYYSNITDLCKDFDKVLDDWLLFPPSRDYEKVMRPLMYAKGFVDNVDLKREDEVTKTRINELEKEIESMRLTIKNLYGEISLSRNHLISMYEDYANSLNLLEEYGLKKEV